MIAYGVPIYIYVRLFIVRSTHRNLRTVEDPRREDVGLLRLHPTVPPFSAIHAELPTLSPSRLEVRRKWERENPNFFVTAALDFSYARKNPIVTHFPLFSL